MRKLAARSSPLAVHVDRVSLLVTCPAEMPLKELDGHLKEEGFTLGYQPLKMIRTLREALEQRTPNRLASRYGEIDDICVSIKVVRKGKKFTTRNVPRASTGPDFKKIFIGSRGRYGKIVEATLKVSPIHRFTDSPIHRKKYA